MCLSGRWFPRGSVGRSIVLRLLKSSRGTIAGNRPVLLCRGRGRNRSWREGAWIIPPLGCVMQPLVEFIILVKSCRGGERWVWAAGPACARCPFSPPEKETPSAAKGEVELAWRKAPERTGIAPAQGGGLGRAGDWTCPAGQCFKDQCPCSRGCSSPLVLPAGRKGALPFWLCLVPSSPGS